MWTGASGSTDSGWLGSSLFMVVEVGPGTAPVARVSVATYNEAMGSPGSSTDQSGGELLDVAANRERGRRCIVDPSTGAP